MSFFSNKHVITALIVAPLLAVGSWYLVDLAVKEKPQPAVAGKSYPLVAKSNCRYSSGDCDLVNADFRSQLQVTKDPDGQVLVLRSSHPVQSVLVGFVTAKGDELEPVAMHSRSADQQHWETRLTVAAGEDTQIRLAITADRAHYFAETSLAFSQYQTTFNKDFRQ